MKILLISESGLIYSQMKRIVGENAEVNRLSFEEMEEKELPSCDIIIIEFDYMKMANKKFKIILDIKCKKSLPILALLEGGSISDQFEILAMGALDFLEIPATDERFSEKLHQLYKWKWYYDRENKTIE